MSKTRLRCLLLQTLGQFLGLSCSSVFSWFFVLYTDTTCVKLSTNNIAGVSLENLIAVAFKDYRGFLQLKFRMRLRSIVVFDLKIVRAFANCDNIVYLN